MASSFKHRLYDIFILIYALQLPTLLSIYNVTFTKKLLVFFDTLKYFVQLDLINPFKWKFTHAKTIV